MTDMNPKRKIYLALGATDLRNNIDGLALMVQYQFKLDPFAESYFVFCNRNKNKLKILYWDKCGFWLFYRRLEKGTFAWPTKVGHRKAMEITSKQLSFILDGITLDGNDKNKHQEVLQRKLI